MPVGIVEKRDRAVLLRRDDLADDEVDLHDAAGQRRRRGERQQAFDLRRQPRPFRREGETEPDDP
jgi:hypothetical protein